MLGTSLSLGSPSGDVVLRIRPRSPAFPLGSPPSVTSLQPWTQLNQPCQSPVPASPCSSKPLPHPQGCWRWSLHVLAGPHKESFSPIEHSHGPAGCGGPMVPTELPQAGCPSAAGEGLPAPGSCGCSGSLLQGKGHELNVSNLLLTAASQWAGVPSPGRRAGLSPDSPLCSGAVGSPSQGLQWSPPTAPAVEPGCPDTLLVAQGSVGVLPPQGWMHPRAAPHTELLLPLCCAASGYWSVNVPFACSWGETPQAGTAGSLAAPRAAPSMQRWELCGTPP